MIFRSIRFKLSVGLLLLFIPFVGFLFFSNFYFFRDYYKLELVKDQEDCEKLTSVLADKAESLVDERQIEAYLASEVKDGMHIGLYNPSGNSVWSAGAPVSDVMLTARDFIVVGGAIRYELRVQEGFNFKGQVYTHYMLEYRYIPLLLTCVLFAFVIAFIHITVTKPIYALRKRMEESPLKIKIDRKRYRNDEIGVFEKRFDEMIVNLQKADQEQLTMLAAISHDLKTPLTSIITYTDRLSSGKVAQEDKRRHYYEVIRQKADIIRQLINKIQDAYILTGRDVTAASELLPAAEFWRSVLEPYTEEWDDVDAHLDYYGRIDESAAFYGDRTSLTRALANILDNAVKYGSHPLHVCVELSRDEKNLILRIENNGRQVPEDVLPLLFDRFYRADASRSQEGGGIGLGLYICRVIIEKHGGTIRAYKPSGNDFGIELTVPLADS